MARGSTCTAAPRSPAPALYDLLSRVEATYWRVPPPDAGTVLTWLRKVAEARRDQSVFGAGPKWREDFHDSQTQRRQGVRGDGNSAQRARSLYRRAQQREAGLGAAGRQSAMYVPTAALVTDLAVHFKQGHDNSLVWVTSLEQGPAGCGRRRRGRGLHWRRTVEGAHRLARNRAGARGCRHLTTCPNASRPRIREAATRIPTTTCSQNEALRALDRGLIVTARYGSDFSFDRTNWQSGIEPWRFHLPTEYPPSRLRPNRCSTARCSGRARRST